jgi:hypothetical protein
MLRQASRLSIKLTGLPAFRGVSFGLHRQGRRGVPTEIASPAFRGDRNDILWAPVTEGLPFRIILVLTIYIGYVFQLSTRYLVGSSLTSTTRSP